MTSPNLVRADEQFLASSEGVRTVLTLLDRMGPEGWHRLPAATQLLRLAQRKFTPVAKAWHRPPEDAMYAAWMAMRTRSVRTARDPWAAITRAVQLSVQAECVADRLLISAEAARRPEHRPCETPARTGESGEFFYDIAADHHARNPGSEPNRLDHLVQTCAAFLVVVGWQPGTAQQAVEYVAMRACDMGSHASALDGLRRDGAARLRLDLDQAEWTALLTLLLGRSPLGHPDEQQGLFARVLLGDTLADLLDDATVLTTAQHSRTGADHE